MKFNLADLNSIYKIQTYDDKFLALCLLVFPCPGLTDRLLVDTAVPCGRAELGRHCGARKPEISTIMMRSGTDNQTCLALSSIVHSSGFIACIWVIQYNV